MKKSTACKKTQQLFCDFKAGERPCFWYSPGKNGWCEHVITIKLETPYGMLKVPGCNNREAQAQYLFPVDV